MNTSNRLGRARVRGSAGGYPRNEMQLSQPGRQFEVGVRPSFAGYQAVV